MICFNWHIERTFTIIGKYVLLPYSLSVILINPFRWPVCCNNYQWNLLIKCFYHCRRIIQYCRAGSADYCNWQIGLLGYTECKKGRTAFINYRKTFYFLLSIESNNQWSIPGT